MSFKISETTKTIEKLCLKKSRNNEGTKEKQMACTLDIKMKNTYLPLFVR